ncbi:PAS domain S-box protein [Hyphomonas sp.]|uniref:PAS domain S-box protein n=2 Tax=Hyphomonas sp. TaxID=87 RepID=UPI0025C2AF99|nr:PAS domain S-box protein [Hyphomonas sp.]
MKRDETSSAPSPVAHAPALSAAESSWLSAIITSSTDAIISKTLDGIIASWNPAAERVFGYTPQEMIGKSIRLLIPADRQQEEDEILATIQAGKTISNFETVRLRKDGSELHIMVTVSPIHDADGRIVGASKIVRDISREHENQERLRQSEAQFKALADNIPQLAWMSDPEGHIFWYNKRWYEYTGADEASTLGHGWRSVHHPEHEERATQHFLKSLKAGEVWEDTFPLRGRNGKFRWFLSRAHPIRGQDGNIQMWFGTNTDITDQKQREERIQLLMGEVNHRAKNMLTLVQAIARQTMASGENFMGRFTERMRSLASSQDLLVSSGWRGARVEDIMKSQLSHLDDFIGTRIVLEGPHVRLNSAAAQSLGMALHELATNAGKYGALSNDTGKVDIRWNVRQDEGVNRFEICWTESGGPPVTVPDRRGFGSTVIERMTRIAFGYPVKLDFAPEGLHWHLISVDDRVFESDFVAEEASSSPADLSAPARPSAPAPAPASGQRRVLVVEDEAIIAIDMAAALEDAGFSVIGPVGSVFEAMQLLDEKPCDCAVLDINLAGETSAPVASRLLADGIPFVTVSGNTPESTGDEFSQSPFLSKPIITSKLLAKLDQLVPAPAASVS